MFDVMKSSFVWCVIGVATIAVAVAVVIMTGPRARAAAAEELRKDEPQPEVTRVSRPERPAPIPAGTSVEAEFRTRIEHGQATGGVGAMPRREMERPTKTTIVAEFRAKLAHAETRAEALDLLDTGKRLDKQDKT